PTASPSACATSVAPAPRAGPRPSTWTTPAPATSSWSPRSSSSTTARCEPSLTRQRRPVSRFGADFSAEALPDHLVERLQLGPRRLGVVTESRGVGPPGEVGHVVDVEPVSPRPLEALVREQVGQAERRCLPA